MQKDMALRTARTDAGWSSEKQDLATADTLKSVAENLKGTILVDVIV